MAQYVPDFSTADDWTERWDTASGSVTAATSGEQRLIIAKAYDEQYGLTWDLMDPDEYRADFEVLAKVRYTGPAYAGTNTLIGVFGRGAGATAGLITGVYAMLAGGNTLSIRQRIGGSLTVLGTVSFTVTQNAWYWVRMRAQGTNVKMRAWLHGETEPGTWDLDVTTTLTDAGWIGIRSYESTSEPYEFAWFGVGTGGDEAPGGPLAGSSRVQFIGV